MSMCSLLGLRVSCQLAMSRLNYSAVSGALYKPAANFAKAHGYFCVALCAVVVNREGQLEDTVTEIQSILTAERCSTKRCYPSEA